MRKLKIFSIVLLFLSAAAFAGFQAYTRVVRDTKAPVITCESDELTVPVDASDEDLLEGVTAKDNRSGDVTDTVVVESLSAFTEEGKRIITYAAVDESMNVGHAERTLVYEDYKAPVFHMTGPLVYSVGDTVNLLSSVTAESVLDGDLSSKVKYSLEKTISTSVAGEYPVEFRVMDSGGNTVYLKTQVCVAERNYGGIDVSLSDYLIYLSVGDAFDPSAYYTGADEEGTLDIQSNVNTAEAGSYYVDYIVNGTSLSGRSRLVVIVQ